jgi:hypothetical protein
LAFQVQFAKRKLRIPITVLSGRSDKYIETRFVAEYPPFNRAGVQFKRSVERTNWQNRQRDGNE